MNDFISSTGLSFKSNFFGFNQGSIAPNQHNYFQNWMKNSKRAYKTAFAINLKCIFSNESELTSSMHSSWLFTMNIMQGIRARNPLTPDPANSEPLGFTQS